MNLTYIHVKLYNYGCIYSALVYIVINGVDNNISNSGFSKILKNIGSRTEHCYDSGRRVVIFNVNPKLR